MADKDNGTEATRTSDGGARLMKTVVIVLGIMLIVGFVVVFSTIIYRTVKLADDRAPPGNAGPVVPGELAVPQGARIDSMVLDGNRLAIHLTGAGNDEIVIVDVRRGEEISRVRLVPAGGGAAAEQ